MARAALGWSVKELAEYAGVGERTVARFEASDHRNMQIATYERIVRCLEQGGILFLAADGVNGAGVRAKDPKFNL